MGGKKIQSKHTKIANASKFRRDNDIKVRSAGNRCRKQKKTRGKSAANEGAKGYNLKGNGGDPRGGPKKTEKRCFGQIHNQSEMDLKVQDQI